MDIISKFKARQSEAQEWWAHALMKATNNNATASKVIVGTIVVGNWVAGVAISKALHNRNYKVLSGLTNATNGLSLYQNLVDTHAIFKNIDEIKRQKAIEDFKETTADLLAGIKSLVEDTEDTCDCPNCVLRRKILKRMGPQAGILRTSKEFHPKVVVFQRTHDGVMELTEKPTTERCEHHKEFGWCLCGQEPSSDKLN